MAGSEEELKSLLMRMKEETEKAGLKLNTQNTKITASGPITSWQTEGEKSGNGDRFYFLRLKNHWGVTTTMTFKDVCFLKESYDKPRQRIQKQRHTFSTKVYLVKTMVFLLVMYGYESWFVKKAEHQRIDAFELWCWRRLLRVPWTARRSRVNSKGNHLWIFIGRTDADAPILWPLDAKSQVVGIDPDAGKDWRQEENGVTEDEMIGWHHQVSRHLSKLQEIVEDRGSWHTAVHGIAESDAI